MDKLNHVSEMFAVTSGTNGHARFGYRIDLGTNKVTYVIDTTRFDMRDWPLARSVYDDYSDALEFFEFVRGVVDPKEASR